MNLGFDLEGGVGAMVLSFIVAALVFFQSYAGFPFHSRVTLDLTDFAPFLARHAQGDWGELDEFDKRQNDTAVKGGYRILSAYDILMSDGEAERIWIITKGDRSVATALLPGEY